MYIAEDYMSEISMWSDVNYYEKYVRRIQLPFVAAPVSTVSVEQQRERRKEAARRLVELNAKKREEKVRLIVNNLYIDLLLLLIKVIDIMH